MARVSDQNSSQDDSEDDVRSSGKGRGWHGNSADHARAGRLGGLARRRRDDDE